MNFKTDLATSIFIAIFGVVAAFLVCNLFVGSIDSFPVKTVDTTVTAELTEPDAEVFNYKALNPTVEVYVGDCTEIDEYGECIDGQDNAEIIDDIIILEGNDGTNQENL